MEEQVMTGAEEIGGAFGVLRTRVELWVLVVFMGIAFVAGMFVQFGEQPATQTFDTPVAESGPVGPPPVAGPLTDEQLKAGLPTNHPPTAGDPNGAATTTAPSR